MVEHSAFRPNSLVRVVLRSDSDLLLKFGDEVQVPSLRKVTFKVGSVSQVETISLYRRNNFVSVTLQSATLNKLRSSTFAVRNCDASRTSTRSIKRSEERRVGKE